MLSDEAFPSATLLSGVRPIEEVEQALRAMIDKQALKVVIRDSKQRTGGSQPRP
jgi:hypothetical protein